MCSLEATHDLNAVGNRAVAQCQPKATENPLAKHKTLVWSCYAELAKMNTGKASGTWTHERAGPFNGCSEEEVLAAREKFMKQYMNPATRNRKRSIDAVEAAACEGRKQPRRDAAPVAQQLDATSRKPGPTSETAKAGPGRGKGRQSAAGASLGTIPEERVLPPELPAGNWLARLSLQKQWQSSAMDALQRTVKRLEREMLAKDETIEQQARTIDELREKVKDLEQLQMTAAEELASFIKLDPVLKQASHAQVLEEDPDFALVIGLGYVGAQKQSLIYKHLYKLKERLREITAGDAVKAKALSEMLYLRTHAGEKRVQSNAAKNVEHRRDIAEGIVDSIRRFVHALHDAGGNGRYPQKIRQAMQVIATAVCRAVALSKAKITIKEVGDALGLNPNLVSECTKRFDSLDDGEWEQLFDDRGTKRSDAMCEEWVEFAREFWTNPELANESHEAYNFTRRAESMSKVVRDPAHRKGGETHRIHWLEETIGLMHETMLQRGKQIFGGDFHMSWSFFLDLRPYYVKDATRETCMCVYHLRFEEMANGLLSYRRALRREKVANCSCQIPANSREFRMGLLCPRRAAGEMSGDSTADSGDGNGAHSTLDNLECLFQRCEECKDLRKLVNGGPCSLCDEEIRDPTSNGEALKVKFECYEKIKYSTKDGTEKERKDFISMKLPFSEFKQKLEDYWPKFIAHHNDAKWHDDDFISMKVKLPRGHVVLVIDFAENYSHQPKCEHQSKYFSQVQTTIVPVVLMFRIEDLTNVSDSTRSELIELFDTFELPHVVTETHYLISSDMQHDNAFIQKGLDDHIIPYIQACAPVAKALHVRSDGCKAQFKCASNFYLVSRQSAEGCGLQVNWTFFASCHGKCYCDPEGGTLKNAARQHELNIHDKAMQLRDAEDLYNWASTRSGLSTPRYSLSHKKGKGIFRRFFYWIPSKGIGAVNRARLPKFTADGTSRLHEFLDVGVAGTVSTRRAACKRCDSCWNFDRSNCANLNYTGSPKELKIVQEHVATAAAERMTRAAVNRDGLARAQTATLGSIVCVETHKDEQMHPWVIGKVLDSVHDAASASPPFDASKDALRLEPLKVSEPALKLQLYEALDAGSCTYFISQMIVRVPARSVRVVDVQLGEARSSARVQAQSRARYKIEAASLEAIRAEMPTRAHEWAVERVLQYRCVYGVEQWLVKWKDYGEDRNTWEPWENFTTPEVQDEVNNCRELAVKEASDVNKFTIVTLKAVLECRGLESTGQKAILVQRVRDVLHL